MLGESTIMGSLVVKLVSVPLPDRMENQVVGAHNWTIACDIEESDGL